MTMKDWDKERMSKYFDTTGLMNLANDTIQTENVKPIKKKIIISEPKVKLSRKAVRGRRVLPLSRPNLTKR
jgi:hypothetical protein